MAGKANVGARAAQFLSQIGTAGGPVGAATSPGLVGYGAGTLREQLIAGNTDPYAMQRMGAGAPIIGSPAHQLDPALNNAAPMPANLDTGYLHLNQPGSPLPMYGMMADHNMKAAQITQDNIRAMDQRMLTGMMPPTGQLVVDPGMSLPIQGAVAAAQQLGANAARQRKMAVYGVAHGAVASE
jgi:hypothetical protein